METLKLEAVMAHCNDSVDLRYVVVLCVEYLSHNLLPSGQIFASRCMRGASSPTHS